MTDSVITVEGLRRSYGRKEKFEAVRGIDLNVERGELFALLGTNGAGKTSALEVLEGLAPATEGTVRVLGCDPYAERVKVRPYTGIVLQDAGFPSTITVQEMMNVWARTLPRTRSIPETLADLGLTERAKVNIRSLSGGERRRLDLALAILGKPEVLFLDEPTSGLDPESRARLWDLVRRLQGEGVTILLTTHYLEEAEALADRIAIMASGVIVREGTAMEIVADQPASISFNLRAEAEPLPPLIGDARRQGDAVTITTKRPQADLLVLLNWADAHQLDLGALEARPGSLEQAFLSIAASNQKEIA